MVAVSTGVAYEANPLLAPLVEKHLWVFAGVKFLLVVLGAWLLWRLRRYRLAIIAIFFGFIIYYALLIFHLFHWVRVFGS